MRYHPFAHTGLKIVSVALAVLLWMMVSSQRASVERGLRIPLELQNLPENLEMVEPPQEAVDVRVRGTADALGRICARRSRGQRRPELRHSPAGVSFIYRPSASRRRSRWPSRR